MEEEIEVRLPSSGDPFDIRGCDQYPLPLNPEEDATLKHIIKVTCSDQQMFKRAYDSIICMWAKKEIACIPSIAVSTWPPSITIAAIGNNVGFWIYGTGILAGSNILYKGLYGLNPNTGSGGPAGSGAGPYVTATLQFGGTGTFVSGPIPVAIVGPGKVISNSLSVTVTLNP